MPAPANNRSEWTDKVQERVTERGSRRAQRRGAPSWKALPLSAGTLVVLSGVLHLVLGFVFPQFRVSRQPFRRCTTAFETLFSPTPMTVPGHAQVPAASGLVQRHAIRPDG